MKATSTGTAPAQLAWPSILVVVAIHLGAALALVPWFFSWTGVALAFAGCYVFGTLGINLGYHRLLTHRSLSCPLWLEHTLAVLGVCCLEKTPGHFVTHHRVHHQHSDKEEDPHSPLSSLFWGHMGWVMVENPRLDTWGAYEKYSRDLMRDRFYIRLEQKLLWMQIYLAHALLFFLAGFAWGTLAPGGSAAAGWQFGLSVLVWGVLLRTVLVWHITWSVNSVAHVWGYRNYETRENSRNNFFVGLISNGEGWHNNHHAQPRAAAHGHKWWELDITYATIVVMSWFGLAWNIAPVRASSEASSEGSVAGSAA